MRKLVYIGNILSTVPAALVVPLVPFTFLLIDGEGRIPGLFHEHLLRALMLTYPVTLAACLWLSVRLLRRDRPRAALGTSLVPLGVFLLLLWTYIAGGVMLR